MWVWGRNRNLSHGVPRDLTNIVFAICRHGKSFVFPDFEKIDKITRSHKRGLSILGPRELLVTSYGMQELWQGGLGVMTRAVGYLEGAKTDTRGA